MTTTMLRSALAAFALLLPAAALATPTAAAPALGAKLMGATRLDGPLFHVQGVEIDQGHVFVTSVDRKSKRGYLSEFDQASGRMLRSIELTDGARYHPGGISMAGGSIWVPVAEMRRNSSAVLVEIDAATLTVRRRIAVADHLGCVAASGSRLVAGNWDSREFYIFDLAGDGKPRIVANPSHVAFQDMKIVGDELVAGGQSGGHKGKVDWIDMSSMTVTRTLAAGTTRKPRLFRKVHSYAREGMTVKGDDLYFVPDDGRGSRLFHFRLDEHAAPVATPAAPATPLRIASAS